MDKTFTLKDPKPMGEHDPKYGQAWWSYTYDSDMPVMFNLMEGSVGDGTVISTPEWVNKQSAKGTEYLRLKKVKIHGETALTATKPTNDERILQKLDKIIELLEHAPEGEPSGLEKARAVRQTLTTTTTDSDEDVVLEDIGDGPINLSDIPF